MQAPVNPANEADRMRALKALRILDTPPEAEFDTLTRLAAHLLDTPIALVTLVDENRQWFKSKYGLETSETSRAISFCGHVVAAGQPLCVGDAPADNRFSDNPLVTGEPQIRAYAGHPLVDNEGHCLGTVCVIDRRSRQFTAQQQNWLAAIAVTVNTQLLLRRTALRLQEVTDSRTTLLNALPGLYFLLSADQRFLEVHGADRQNLLADPEMFLGKSVTEVLPAPVGPNIAAALERARKGQAVEIVDYELMIGGEMKYFQARIAHTAAQTFVVYVQNTTPGVLTLRRLETANKLLELVVDAQSRILLDTDYPPQLDRLLGELMTFTQSEFGLLGEIEEGNGNSLFFRPHTVRRKGAKSGIAPSAGKSPPPAVPLHPENSLLADTIARHRPLALNANDPRLAQLHLPVAHPPFTSVLVIPIRTGLSALNLLVLANRADGYSERLLADLHPMTNTIAHILELASSRSRRKAVEKALQEKEFQYQRIVELAQEGVWMIDANGCTTFANRRMATLLGTTVENMIGTTVLEFLFPEDIPAAQEQLDRRRQGISDQFDFRFRRLDGREVFCALQTATLFDANRVYLGAMAMVMDVTDRRRTELAVQERDRRYAGIIESASDAIITIDTAGTIQQINPAASRHLGYQPGELLGKNVQVLMPPRERELHDSYLANYQKTGVRKIIGIGREVIVMRKNGSSFPAELSVNEFTVSGKIYFTGIVRDISDRKRVERMQAEFIATVSHELRTPLTGIRGALGLIAGGAAGSVPGEIAGYIEIALANSETLIRLVNEILEAEKLQEGSLEFDMQVVPLAAALEQARLAILNFATTNQVKLEPPTGAIHSRLRADPDRLVQVLNNLLSNAIKHAPPDSPVEIEVEARGDRVRVQVLDRGPGVAASFLDRLFQRFSQEDSSTSRRHVGTGLGLSIAKAIVERMEGRIGYQPRNGGGACFWFELPCVREAATTP